MFAGSAFQARGPAMEKVANNAKKKKDKKHISQKH